MKLSRAEREHEMFIWRHGWEDTLTASGMTLSAAKEWIAARELLWNLTMPASAEARRGLQL